MNLTFREMKRTDWEMVKHIYELGIASSKATFEVEAPTYEAWDTSHLPYARLIAEIDNVIVGWAALSPISKRLCYSGVAEVSIYLDPLFARKGIGKKLLGFTLELAQLEGIWTIQSSIMADNSASIALHEAVGFRVVGYRERIAKDYLGEWRDTVLMEKRF